MEASTLCRSESSGFQTTRRSEKLVEPTPSNLKLSPKLKQRDAAQRRRPASQLEAPGRVPVWTEILKLEAWAYKMLKREKLICSETYK